MHSTKLLQKLPGSWLVALLGLGILCAPSGQAAAPAKGLKQPGTSIEAGAYLNPDSVRKNFAEALTSYFEAGQCTAAKVLLQQLKDRKQCSVRPARAERKRLEATGVFEKARRGTLIVGAVYKCNRCTSWHAECATGFVLTEDGTFASNFHVVERMTSSNMVAMGIMTYDGQVFPVKAVLAGDEHNDLAVIKAQATGLQPLGIAGDIQVGEAAYSLSHPVLVNRGNDQGFYMFSPGMVSGKYAMSCPGGGTINVLAVTCEYAGGSSGGPILDCRGSVVGVICQAFPVNSGTSGSRVQMIWHLTRPSEGLLRLVAGPMQALP